MKMKDSTGSSRPICPERDFAEQAAFVDIPSDTAPSFDDVRCPGGDICPGPVPIEHDNKLLNTVLQKLGANACGRRQLQ